jgi:hypothetical protein
MRKTIGALLCVLWVLGGCGGAGGSSSSFEFQELADQGLTRYLGTARPARSVEIASGDTIFEFEPGDGPICLHGGPFRAAVRRSDSEDLVIYLQGGGACSSAVCIVTFADTDSIFATGVPAAGILSAILEANPVRDWNVVYSPYCDGSLMMGDVERDVDGDGQIEHQLGLRNLSAVIDLAKAEFPRPRRILLTGISAGGYATFAALPLVRKQYPGAEILVVNDSGVGIGVPGDEGGVLRLAAEFNAGALLPASCSGCFDRGHLLPLLSWQLERDPNVRAGIISSFGDIVISATFLGISAGAFEAALRAESGAIAARFPDRFKRFLFPGIKHTTLAVDASSDLREAIDVGIEIDVAFLEMILGRFDVTEIGGVTVADWVTGMVGGGEWNDLVGGE